MNGYMLEMQVDGGTFRKWFTHYSEAEIYQARYELKYGEGEEYTIRPATKQERLERQGGGSLVHGSYEN